ncbi:hypothetical protein ONO23_05855 [Micromonospora noduli]|uniref:hypothetical protein n=1 Tax=Micromonospora noduli TaxID=709876 RepID=UPI000DC00478|nr:hypothetical protein [Micromonospora noduli]RAO25503.1 hypothetical protein ONO23_05855 [Micromonospora noduli]
MSLTETGTLIAIISGLGALAFGLRTDLRQRRLEREVRADKDRHQARRVAGWILVRQLDDGVQGGTSGFRAVRSHAFVQNASDEPIWDVEVRVPEVELAGGEVVDLMERHYFEVIGPGEVLDIELPDTPPFDRLPLVIKFADNAGRRWLRDERGKLKRLVETGGS